MQRDLVERARRGDHDAFAVLAGATIGRLDAAARLILKDPYRAQDAVQETLVRCWRDLPTLRDVDRFDAWLHRLFLNACRDELRSAKRRSIEVELPEIHPLSVSDTQSASADRDLIERGVRHLHPEHRTVLILHYYLGLPLPDAAAAMGGPVGYREVAALSGHPGAARGARFGCASPPRALGGSFPMTQRHDLDRMLTAWLDDPYMPPAPHYLGQVLEQTRHTRQRPAWANLERWIPMADRIPRPATAGPMRLAWFTVVALLVIALAAGAALVGSRLLQSPNDGLDSSVTVPSGGAAVLAFASIVGSGGDIYIVRADGTDLRQLTSGPGAETAPAFSPDGRSIAYRVYEGGNDSLVVMDAGGGNPRTLATNSSTGSYCARGEIAWSPDGSSLVFPVSSDCDVGFDLFIVAADGSAPATKLLAGDTDSLHPAWSPDGTQVAFSGSNASGGVDLYLADLGPGGALSGGLTARRFGTSSGDLANSGAAIQWSPDGTMLAIQSEAGDVVIIGADGSGSRVLAQGAFSPRWSPDGRRVAFHRTVDPSEYVNDSPCTVRTWVIDADGTNERRLDDLGLCEAPPRWSPDGTRLSGPLIASTAAEPTLGPHLGIITIDGSRPTVILPDGPSVSWQPVAAPLPPPSPVTSPSP